MSGINLSLAASANLAGPMRTSDHRPWLQHAGRTVQVLLLTLMLLVVVTPWAQAKTITVKNTSDSGQGSLRDAIANAASGDTIDFLKGMHGTISLYTGELLISSSNVSNLTIVGPGSKELSISGRGNLRVFNNNTSVSISGLTIRDGSTTAWGGGVQNTPPGVMTLTDCVITHNTASFGGGICNTCDLWLINCQVTDNISGQGGGGVANGLSLNLDSCTISNNTSGNRGGGIYNEFTSNATNCTISGNKATYGGGIENYATAGGDLYRCTISGNQAESQGGGVYNFGSTSTYLSACTISDNRAGYQGGGVWTKDTSIKPAPSVVLFTTIVAQNSASSGPDLFGAFSTQNNNLIGDSTGSLGFSDPTLDQYGTAGHTINAGLDSLANNGGPTWTQALLPGSPAIDRGGSFSFFDQRGKPTLRAPDVGAFEAQFGPLRINLISALPSKGLVALTVQVLPNGSPTSIRFYIDNLYVGAASVSGIPSPQTATLTVPITGHRAHSFYATATNNDVRIWPTAPSFLTFTPDNNAPTASDARVILTGSSVALNLKGYVSDQDHDAVSLVSTTDGSFGTVSITGTSTVVYTATGPLPSTGDFFTYTVTDNYSTPLQATATVWVYPQPSAGAKGDSVSFLSSANLSGSNLKIGTVTLSGSTVTTGTITTLGVPAISDSSSPVIAVSATLQVTGTPLPPAIQKPLAATVGAVLSGGLGGPLNVVAAQGQTAPDTTGTGSFGTFASLADPVVDANGNIAFVGKIAGTGIYLTNNTGIWTTAPDGKLRRARLTGETPTGVGMAKLASFPAISLLSGSMELSGSTGEVLVYQATLASSGTSLVTAANNAGMWSQLILPLPASPVEKLLVRTGTSKVPGTTATVKTFNTFGVTSGSPGQGRAYVTPDYLAFQALLSDGKQQAIMGISTTGTTPLETLELGGTNGTLLGSTDPLLSGSTVVSGTTITWGPQRWLSFGVPAMSGTQILAVSGTCQIMRSVGAKLSLTSTAGIFVETGSSFEPLALVGRRSNGFNGLPWGATFTVLKDPVVNPVTNDVAFIGTTTGLGTAKGSGIWWTEGVGVQTLLAMSTLQDASLPTGVFFATFQSIALTPDTNNRLIFVATLSGSGVTTSNNVGLFVADTTGTITRLVRTGDHFSIGGATKTLTAIDVISAGAAPSTPGVTRSFNGQQKIVYRATLKDDKTLAITQTVLTIDLTGL